MTKFMIALVFMGSVALVAENAYAQASNCSFIRDPDQRALCRAQTGGSTSQCSFIGDPDTRALCRAVVGGNRSQCSFIRNTDQRDYCRAVVR